MDTTDKKSIIHRKAKGAREDFNARVMSPDKALRLALAKTSDKLLDLAITVTTVEQLLIPHARLRQEAGDDGLLVLLDGAGGARGAVKLDTQFLTALIEVQTTGKVRPAAAEPREFTRTDAAIAATLVDAMLRGFDEQLKAADPEYVALSYRFGDMIEDSRALSLALEAPDYDLFRLTVDIAEGAKTGMLMLMLPKREDVPVPGKPAAKSSGAGFKTETHALEAPVTMDAVLARVRMPLKDVCALTAGALIPIAADCLGKAQLVATGDHVVARVAMGQMNGWRAVKLATASAPNANGARGGGAQMPPSDPLASIGMLGDDDDDVVDGIAEPMPGLPDLPMAGLPDLPDLPPADDAEVDLAALGMGLPMAQAMDPNMLADLEDDAEQSSLNEDA